MLTIMSDKFTDLNGSPPIDENGVDLSVIDYCLSLTPAQRLQQAQSFANFILSVRKLNGIQGIPWENHDSSTGTNFSVE